MEEQVHLLAAKYHFEIAEQKNQEYEREQDLSKHTALRSVTAQNYFYASINWIEAVFALDKEHSFNHENRMSKIREKIKLFSQEIIDLYSEVGRNQRNRVAYRGENGLKYENIKRLAKLLKERYDKI